MADTNKDSWFSLVDVADKLTKNDLIPILGAINDVRLVATAVESKALTTADLVPFRTSLNTLQTNVTTQNAQLATVQQGLITLQAAGVTTAQLNGVQQTLQQAIDALQASTATSTQVAALQSVLNALQANAVNHNHLAMVQQALQQDIRNVQSNALARNDLVPLKATIASILTGITKNGNLVASARQDLLILQQDLKDVQRAMNATQASSVTQAELAPLEASINSILSTALTQKDLDKALRCLQVAADATQANTATRIDVDAINIEVRKLIHDGNEVLMVTFREFRKDIDRKIDSLSQTVSNIREQTPTREEIQQLLAAAAPTDYVKPDDLTPIVATLRRIEDNHGKATSPSPDIIGNLLKDQSSAFERLLLPILKHAKEDSERDRDARFENLRKEVEGLKTAPGVSRPEDLHEIQNLKIKLARQEGKEAGYKEARLEANDKEIALCEEIHKLHDKLLDTHKANVDLEKKALIAQHQYEVDQLTAANSASNAVSSELAKENAKLKEQMQQLKAQATDSQAQRSAGDELKLVGEKLTALETKHKAVENRITDINTKLEVRRDARLSFVDKKIAGLSSELNTFGARVGTLEKELPRIKTVEAEGVKFQASIDTLKKEELKGLDRRVAGIEEQVTRIDTVAHDVTELQNDTKALRDDELKLIENKLTILSNDLGGCENRIDDFETEVPRIRTIERKVVDLSTRGDNVVLAGNILSYVVETLRSKQDDSEELHNQLFSRIYELEEQPEDLRIDGIQYDVLLLQVSLEEARNIAQKAMQETFALRETTQTISTENDILKAQLKKILNRTKYLLADEEDLAEIVGVRPGEVTLEQITYSPTPAREQINSQSSEAANSSFFKRLLTTGEQDPPTTPDLEKSLQGNEFTNDDTLRDLHTLSTQANHATPSPTQLHDEAAIHLNHSSPVKRSNELHNCSNVDVCGGLSWTVNKFSRHTRVCNKIRHEGGPNYDTTICPYCNNVKKTETPDHKEWFWRTHVPKCWRFHSKSFASADRSGTPRRQGGSTQVYDQSNGGFDNQDSTSIPACGHGAFGSYGEGQNGE